MTMPQNSRWDLEEGAGILLGVETAARQLIIEMDGRLSNRDTKGKVDPETKGIAVVCIMTCAYFCELALKTLYASLTGGGSLKGHDLEELYREVQKEYSKVCAEAQGSLERQITNEIEAYYSDIPKEWWPSNIRMVLKVGGRNFTDWRYDLVEGRESAISPGLPRQLYAIAAGVFNVCLKLNPALWGEPGQTYFLPNPTLSRGGGFSVVQVE